MGTKKGEKIDYAIAHDGRVQVLVEVKINDPLRIEHASQLFRYFAVTNAMIAILTNGETHEFYTDLDAPNRMDVKPLLVLNLSDVDETLLPELAKLTKETLTGHGVRGGKAMIVTLRHRLIRVPARLVHHAGQLILRPPPGPDLLAEILAILRKIPTMP